MHAVIRCLSRERVQWSYRFNDFHVDCDANALLKMTKTSRPGSIVMFKGRPSHILFSFFGIILIFFLIESILTRVPTAFCAKFVKFTDDHELGPIYSRDVLGFGKKEDKCCTISTRTLILRTRHWRDPRGPQSGNPTDKGVALFEICCAQIPVD